MEKKQILSMVYNILSGIEGHWIEEVNTEGSDFNYDSQDIFRTAYEGCVTQWKLIEEYPPETFSKERVEILNNIKEKANYLVKLYEKHRDFFRQYKREKLMLDTYKKRNPHYNSLTDTELMNFLGIYIEIPSQDQYYKSVFYKQYGFLLNDYHFEINVFCKYLLNEIKENFEDNEPYKTFIENSAFAPYFTMGLVYDVYKCTNDEYFEKLTELEFYKSINLLSLYSKLKIQKSKTKVAYYILHKLSNCIKNKEVKNYWLNEILNRLGKTEPNYASKYREITSANATLDDKEIAKEIDELFKPHII